MIAVRADVKCQAKLAAVVEKMVITGSRHRRDQRSCGTDELDLRNRDGLADSEMAERAH